MEINYALFSINCRLTSSGVFPVYKGSMLRGAFGNSLRKAVCTTRHRNCPECLLWSTCPFPMLFIGKKVQLGSTRQDVTIPPYCLEPPPQTQRMHDAGSIISFKLILFSYATAYLPYFIHAFSLMGEQGLGKSTSEHSGTFEVESVFQGECPIYDPQKKLLTEWKTESLSAPSALLNSSQAHETLHLDLLTPLRFKQNNSFSTNISFGQIVLLCIRRVKMLWALEEKEYTLNNYFSCMELANMVITEAEHVQWRDVTRYSGRQGAIMQFGGLVGQVSYTGQLRTFVPFLDFAASAHLGKQTAFGLGKIAYKIY